MRTISSRQGKLGFLVIFICFLVGAFGRGVQESFTVFLLPLAEEFGWPRTSLTGIYSLSLLAAGLSAPLAGLLFDRLGPRRTVLLGLLAVSSGLGVAGFAQSLWHLQLGIGLLGGFATAALGPAVATPLLSRWFRERLGTVIGIVYSSMGVGMLVFLPLAQWVIDLAGWRQAYHGIAVAILTLVLLPVILLPPWGRIAAGAGQPTGAAAQPLIGDSGLTVHDAVRMLPYWGLIAVFFFTGTGMYVVIVQLVAYLVETGVPPLKAASSYGFAGALMPMGMLAFGWLADQIGRRVAAGLSYGVTLLSFIGFYLLSLAPSDLLLTAAMVLLGLSLGSRGPMISSIASSIFGGRNFGTIFGTIAVGGGAGGAFGAFLSGFLHDLTHGYQTGLFFGMFAVILGSMPFWLIREIGRPGSGANKAKPGSEPGPKSPDPDPKSLTNDT